jgi:hypothetical protein
MMITLQAKQKNRTSSSFHCKKDFGVLLAFGHLGAHEICWLGISHAQKKRRGYIAFLF